MICKIGLCLVVALALAAGSEASGVRSLRNKYRNLVGHEGSSVGGGSAAASAAAGANGVSSSVAASAAAAGYGNRGAYPPAAQYQMPHQQHVQHQAPYYPRQRPFVQQHQPHFQHQPAFRHPQHHVRRAPPAMPVYYEDDGGLIDDSAMAYNQFAAPVYGQPPQQYHFGAPQVHHQHRPHHHQHAHQHPHQHAHQHQAGHPGFVKAHRGPAYAPAPAATSSASAAAAAGGNGGGAAAAASAVSGGQQQQYFAPQRDHHTRDEEELHEQYYEPETEEHFEAASGTLGDGRGNFEQGSYARDTESVQTHEDGREDGDHYYNAQAYGKSNDVNNYMAYDNNDEDVVHTPNLFRKKKSKTNFVSNFNKQHRETGSGVVAHDKHSAMYNKDSKKLKENVDQRYTKGADGLVQTKNFNSNTDLEDEDEMQHDTRGLGNFVGVDGVAHAKRAQPNNPAAAAAAAASASFQG